MLLTPTHRKLLTKARHIINSEKSAYICTALLQAGRLSSTHEEAFELRGAIRRSLDGYVVLTDWLACTHPHFYKQLRKEYPNNYSIVYRLAWIDHILKTGEI